MAATTSWPFEETIISLFMRDTLPWVPACCADAVRHGSRDADPSRGLDIVSRLPARVDAARDAACGQDHQFVNRRILTFRMRPKPINVAMIDEPP